ncbi:MAG: hypothetical protein ACLGHC_00180 [Alphaproteobacteria bacterium]
MSKPGLGSDLVDPAVKLLSTAIGIIFEDHADEALTGSAPERFAALRSAGEDVATLSRAAEVLLNRR